MNERPTSNDPALHRVPAPANAAVVFADISGFTALSNRMDPEDLADTMNGCFELIERIVTGYGGTVEQYIGDAAMAFFGADGQAQDPTPRAVDAAVAIRDRIGRLNDDLDLPGRVDVHTGIHAGSVAESGHGRAGARDYAALWTIARVASTLQHAAGDGCIYVSAAARESAGNRFAFERVDDREAAIAAESSPAYRLTSYADRGSDRHREIVVPPAAPIAAEAAGGADTTSADRRQTTVVFANVAGFEALARTMEPHAFAETMNDCFAMIEEIVAERGGVVDKFVLGCAMALFGAPRALEDAARQAVNAAIEIRNRIARFNTERALPVDLVPHVGINTGLVFAGGVGGEGRRDYTVMGETVNLASRLHSAAGPGQILLGPVTRQQTGESFECAATAPLRLKGFAKPITAYDLPSREESIHRASPRTGGRADTDRTDGAEGLFSPIVGREAELATIAERVAKVTLGQGCIISVVAENGLGKSRLLSEARATDAARALPVFEARSLAIGGTLRFHPFVDLLRNWAAIGTDARDGLEALSAAVTEVCGEEADEILPLLATLMGFDLDAEDAARLAGIEGEALEKLIHRSARRLLEKASERGPVMLVFEDLHWADLSSIALLERLLPLAESHGIAFVLLARPDYEVTSERILAYIRDNHALWHEPLRLSPLGEKHCDALIDNLLGTDELPHKTRTLIKRNTEGNPFYIEEVVRSLVEQGAFHYERGRLVATSGLETVEIPGTIEEVIMARVDRLERPAREVLQLASVGGRRFLRRIVERIAPDPNALEATLVELERKQFIFRADSHRSAARKRLTLNAEVEYAFKHALTQESVYQSLLKKRRLELHERYATAIEAVFAERIQDFYGMLAYHYSRADRLQQAEHYLFKAGEEAADTAASAEALHYFREAHRIYLLLHADDAEEQKLAMLEKNIAQALLNTGELTDSVEHFNNALRHFGEWVPKTPVTLYAKLARDLPVVLLHLYFGSRGGKPVAPDQQAMFSCLYNRARAQNPTDPERNFFDNLSAMRYLSYVDPSTVDRAVGIYAATGAFFAFAGLSFDIGRRFLDVAASIVRDNDPIDRFQHAAMGTVLDFHAGEWSGRLDMDEALLERGQRSGLLWDADVYLGMICERDIRKGRFEHAERTLGRLLELSHGYGYEFARSNELAMRALLLVEQRRLAAAREAMQAYYDFRHEDTLNVFALSGMARLETLDGNLAAADQALARADAIVARSGRLAPFYLGAYHTARLMRDVAEVEAVGNTAARGARASSRRALSTAAKIHRELPEALRLAARLDWRLGNRAGARRKWRRAIAEAGRLDTVPELGRIYVDIGTSLGEQPSPTAAFDDGDERTWLSRAREIFTQRALDWDLAQLEARVGRPGGDDGAGHALAS